MAHTLNELKATAQSHGLDAYVTNEGKLIVQEEGLDFDGTTIFEEHIIETMRALSIVLGY